MSQPAEIIKANKFHKDTGYQFTDYSSKSICLTNKENEREYLPKSECKVFPLDGGQYQINIPDWLYEKKKHFFRKI